MDLLGIRQKFIEKSGRYDLATTNVDTHDTDAGADFHINGACIELDLEVETDRDLSRFDEFMIANQYEISLERCRSVKEVWFEDTSGERVQLEKRYLDQIYTDFPDLDAESTGNLLYWAPNIIHRDPKNSTSGSDIKYTGIIVMPPLETGASVVLGTDGYDYKCILAHTAADANKPITGESYATYWEKLSTTAGSSWVSGSSYVSCKLEVYGRFFSKELSVNTDENHWSVSFPNLLVLAALRNLEGFYRNTAGYNDYNMMIQRILDGIDKDLAQWSDAEELQMEG